MKTYIINDIFYTLQGEGYNAGRAAVFCRFSRCNLWTGREEDRSSAICKFCDTDFERGVRYSFSELVQAVDQLWVGSDQDKLVVFTGGEPALQLDQDLVEELWNRDFCVAVETNGTLPLPTVDWVCVSPKAGTKLPDPLVADEIKLVFPQEGLMPDDLLENYELSYQQDCLWLSPMDGPDIEKNTQAAVEWVMEDPMWRLNLQTHKILGIK